MKMATNSMAMSRKPIANRVRLIANETHSREESSDGKQRSYEFLIANENRLQEAPKFGAKADPSSSASADSLGMTAGR
jgi:hypothetical protein